MPLSTIFQLYSGIQFIGGENLSTHSKTTNLPQVTDKLYQVHLPMNAGLGLWCLRPLSKIVHLFRDGQSCWGEEAGVIEENHQPAASH